MSGGWKIIKDGRQRVHLGQIGKGEAKRLRKLARGSRGAGRGKGVDSTDTLAAQPAEGERGA